MADCDLLTRRFRTHPFYDLVVAERMTPDERRATAGLVRDAGFYGVLRPGESLDRRAAAKAIDVDTALLLYTLREGGTLPSFALARLGSAASSTLLRWVADGVLEVELEGEYLSGPAALERMGSKGSGASVSAIGRLSLAALAGAAALADGSVERRAFHLYSAGRRPLTRRLRERLPDGDAVRAFLTSNGEGAEHLARSWQPAQRTARWLHWRRKGALASRPKEGPKGRATYKLYLSPEPESLPSLWGRAMAELAAADAFEVKVGACAAGLLRPDKLIAYFESRERLAQAADRLAERLTQKSAAGSDDIPAQPVPFTAALRADGLLSWGVDPEPDESRSAWRRAAFQGDSWRAWVCLELAKCLHSAREQRATIDEAVRFSRDHIRLSGVDPESWAPDEALERELSGDGRIGG